MGDLKHTSAEVLIADLDMALTFLDVAATSRKEETVARKRQKAREAFATVLNFLSKLTLTASDRDAVENNWLC